MSSILRQAITGQQSDPHPPLLVMMRDRRLDKKCMSLQHLQHRSFECVPLTRSSSSHPRFGNYIVQRVIALAQSPQRDLLFWKLREHMPVLKKSNTQHGKDSGEQLDVVHALS